MSEYSRVRGLLTEAEAEIERLQKENESLKKQIASLMVHRDQQIDKINDLMKITWGED